MPRGKGEWNPAGTARARALRNDPSASERIFWNAVRSDQFGVRFRRQVPKGLLSLDFFVPMLDLAVEIDGEQHDPESDARRDAWLASQGIEVVRIPSIDLFDDHLREAHLQKVWDKVHEELAKRGIEPLAPRYERPRNRKSGENS